MRARFGFVLGCVVCKTASHSAFIEGGGYDGLTTSLLMGAA